MSRRWQTALGLVVSLLLLYWALHDVSPAKVWRHAREAHMGLLLLAVVIQTSAFLIRAARWGIFLRPTLPDVHFHPRFASTCIGFMANNLLPARVGEFARAYALSRSEPISASASFGSLVVERLFDALTLSLCLAVPLLLPGAISADGPLLDDLAGKVILSFLVFGGAAFMLLLFIARPGVSVKLFRLTVGRFLPKTAAEKIGEIVLSFASGLAAMRKPRLVASGFAWSVVHWVWGALALYVGMLAFDITTPRFLGALFLQGVNALAVSIPSSPGFWGAFEASVRVGLSPFGVPSDQALSFAIAFHILTFIPVTLLGLYYLSRLELSWREVEHSEEIVEETG